MSINKCKIINLPKIIDFRGNLSYIESDMHIPFDIKRVYYLYDVPGGSERGSHAHKNLHQFIVAISGGFKVNLDDGLSKKSFKLDRPYMGLYVCPLIWRDLDDFTSGSVCLVIASDIYKADDYIRNYSDYKLHINSFGNY